jgi:hypothetical protein
VIFVLLALSVLAARPGGFRQQLRLVGRRLRIVIVLGGVYVFGSLIMRLAFTGGPVSDYGPAVLAAVLGVVFLVVGRDPVLRGDTGRSAPPRR